MFIIHGHSPFFLAHYHFYISNYSPHLLLQNLPALYLRKPSTIYIQSNEIHNVVELIKCLLVLR